MVMNIKNIPNFNNIYNSVYEEVKSRQKKSNTFVIVRSRKVIERFEEKFNIKTLNTITKDEGVVGYEFDNMVYPFDSIDFGSEENMTMCLLKWA